MLFPVSVFCVELTFPSIWFASLQHGKLMLKTWCHFFPLNLKYQTMQALRESACRRTLRTDHLGQRSFEFSKALQVVRHWLDKLGMQPMFS
jgi:hypothetical protein